MNFQDCPHISRIEKLEEEVKKMIVNDATLETIVKIMNDRFDTLETEIKGVKKDLNNGLIPKKASEWFYGSIGKWIIALLAGNLVTILGFLVKLLLGR